MLCAGPEGKSFRRTGGAHDAQIQGEAALLAAVRAGYEYPSKDRTNGILNRVLAGSSLRNDVAILALATDPAPIE